MNPQVFISHSSKDKEIADAICQHLESQEIPCWMAPRNIEYGSDWTEAIMRGIQTCRVFILVFSEHANDSGHVRREVAKASSLELFVIPFRIQNVLPKSSLGYFLETVHWLDAITPPLEKHLTALSHRISKLLANEKNQESEFALKAPRFGEPRPSSKRKLLFQRVVPIAIATVLTGSVWFWLAHNSRQTDVSSALLANLPAKSVAVLPFESISPRKDDIYFADGVQDEILNNLAQISELKVISRTSVMQYRADAKRDIRQIACALGVSSILEGTVRRDGNRVRVSTQLVDARNDNAVWADSYDRNLNDIFAIQSEVAQTIAEKLSAALSPAQKRQIETTPTKNMAAHDAYLKAKEKLDRVEGVPDGDREGPIRKAVEFLNDAIAQDPNYVQAYCLAAYAHDALYLEFDQTAGELEAADQAINKALSLCPDDPEVLLAYATHLYRGHRNYAEAEKQLDLAKPNLANSSKATYLQALLLRRRGGFDKAVELLRETVSLDPGNPIPWNDLGETLAYTRQYTAAEPVFDKLASLVHDRHKAKLHKEYFTNVLKTGDDRAYRAGYDSLWSNHPGDRYFLGGRLNFALAHREWSGAKDTLLKIKSEDDGGQFAYAGRPAPVASYWILLRRLEGADTTDAPDPAKTRDELQRKVDAAPDDSPEKALLSSTLAVVDALMGNKSQAIAGAERAVGLLPRNKDALDGPKVALNLAAVYAWTGELDLAFDTLNSLATVPYGLFLNYLDEPYWDPLRKDPRFQALRDRLIRAI